MPHDATAAVGWEWAHDFILGMVEGRNPDVEMTRDVSFDIAAAAVLIAYRAGLREGYVRAGVEPPAEEGYSDSDVTDQIHRFDAAFAAQYGFVKKSPSTLGYAEQG